MEVIGCVTEKSYQPAEKLKVVLFYERKDMNKPQTYSMFIRDSSTILDLESFKAIDNLGDDIDGCDLIIYSLHSEGLKIPENGRIEISGL